MLMLLAHIFGWFVARRNRTYDQGKRPLIRLQVPVISIGNVSAGGSGKTPVTELVVNLLRSIRRNPAVVARGYKRRGSGIVVVHDGVRIRTDWTKAGDEPFMLATALDVPVVVGPHKGDAAVYAAGSIACDVVVVDDGFQHRDLYRDLDIVLVDTATVADQRLLPAGRLREPLTSIGRADVVVLTQPSIDANAVRTHMRADAVLAREAPAHLVGEAIWWAGEKIDQLTVRIAVSDSAGNQTVRQFSLEPSDPGIDQSALAEELGLHYGC
jgi:tetraacyldisaccharide 4'-kinase